MSKIRIRKTLLVIITVLALVIAMLPLQAASAGTTSTCFYGSFKGIYRDAQGYHHYVVFRTDKTLNQATWKVSGPLWPQLWGISQQPIYALYSYFGNWNDPFPASSWKICR